MKEIWKDIGGLENKYQISNFGKVKSLPKKKWNGKSYYMSEAMILKPMIDRGYSKIQLIIDGVRRTKYIHRLIAEAFIPNPNNHPEINHIDSNRSNNVISNLEWCDRQYNTDHRVRNQEMISERNEMRLETLENLYYYALNADNISKKDLIDMIDVDLLEKI